MGAARKSSLLRSVGRFLLAATLALLVLASVPAPMAGPSRAHVDGASLAGKVLSAFLGIGEALAENTGCSNGQSGNGDCGDGTGNLGSSPTGIDCSKHAQDPRCRDSGDSNVLYCERHPGDPKCQNPNSTSNSGDSGNNGDSASSGNSGNSGTGGSSDSSAGNGNSGSSGNNNASSSGNSGTGGSSSGSGDSDSGAGGGNSGSSDSSAGSSGSSDSANSSNNVSGEKLATMTFCDSGHSNSPGRRVDIMRNGHTAVTKIRCQ
jgi:hypothetical protein